MKKENIEVCICKIKYPKNETIYWTFSSFTNAIKEVLKAIEDKRINEEDIRYIERVSE
ncbi:MAG: hypothetical protein IJH34_17755 [Romboutsia sp.]|nr:hypothetical protein [Romboutsia sp.]MBQ6631455.1 hypothetical protein [Romboutsia sp.]MBR0369366.1 hypothetical protein [Methanobrevibacter sp.]